MSFAINTNLASLAAQRGVQRSQGDLATSLVRLSSGLRINSARDDAAGLAIAGRMSAQIRGTGQAARNANDAISLAQTADGGLASIDANLQRMRELAVQAANGSNTTSDRASLQLEAAQLQAEVDRIAMQTSFNGTPLLDGSFGSQAFQVGANAHQTITLAAASSMRAGALGTYQGFHTHQGALLIPGYPPQPYSVSVGGAAPISFGMVGVDAKLEADAVNQANIPGLTATVYANVAPAGVSAAAATAAGTASLQLNGVSIALTGATGAGALGANRIAAIGAINAQSALTGVVATDNGSGVVFTAADGRNITASYSAGSFANSTEADFGLWAVAGLYALAPLDNDYVAPPGVTGSVDFVNGGWSASFPIGAMGTAVAALDLSTQAGAATALASLDRALASVASQRAGIGALQNRFAATVESLQSSGESLTASRARIEDADFALETAQLSRSQVLQQASTAMVAQANQLPSRVLQLLR